MVAAVQLSPLARQAGDEPGLIPARRRKGEEDSTTSDETGKPFGHIDFETN